VELLRADTNVFLGGTFFHFGTENDFGGVWLNTYGGRWKRLSYYSVAGMYGGNVRHEHAAGHLVDDRRQNVPAGGRSP